MAKSIRSKWRRKCRAVKRVRYGAKELEQLKKTLGIVDSSSATDVQMESISGIFKVVDSKDVKKTNADDVRIENDSKEDKIVEEKMDMEKTVRIYNKKTLRDQFGNYPVWMSKRSIKNSKKSKTKKGKVCKKSV